MNLQKGVVKRICAKQPCSQGSKKAKLLMKEHYGNAIKITAARKGKSFNLVTSNVGRCKFSSNIFVVLERMLQHHEELNVKEVVNEYAIKP